MKKRLFLVVILAAVIGGGLRYERVINRYLTIGGNFYFNYMPTPYFSEYFTYGHNILSFDIATRWYPVGRKFFIELDLGYSGYTTFRQDEEYDYNVHGYVDTGKTKDSFGGFTISPGFGWTIDTGKIGGFFLSQGFKFPLVLDSDAEKALGFGAFPTAVIYLGLGYAF